jgi:hypothetical protein
MLKIPNFISAARLNIVPNSPPVFFTQKMMSTVYTEMSEELQYMMQLNPKNQNYKLDTGQENPRTRIIRQIFR